MRYFDNKKALMTYNKTKDINLRNEIALNNYNLIYKAIKRIYIPTFHDIEELEQEAFIILLKAVENFDISKGFKFSTYALACLKSISNKKIDYNKDLSLNEPIEDVEGENIELIDSIENKNNIDIDSYCFDNEFNKKLSELLNYEEYTTLKSIYVDQIKQKDLQNTLNKSYWQLDLIRRKALMKLENNPYFKEYKNDFISENEISYLSAYDYSRPKVQNSDVSSPTMEILLNKEKQEEKLYRSFIKNNLF